MAFSDAAVRHPGDMPAPWFVRNLIRLQFVTWILVMVSMFALRWEFDPSLFLSDFVVTAPFLLFALALAALSRWIAMRPLHGSRLAPAAGLLVGDVLGVVGSVVNIVDINRERDTLVLGPGIEVFFTPLIWGERAGIGFALGLGVALVGGWLGARRRGPTQ